MKNLLSLFLLSCISLVTTVFYAAQDPEALHKAAEKGNLERVKTLVTDGADVNARTDEGLFTPLHLAVYNGYKDICEFLVLHNADVNARTDAEDTPLHLAACKGYKDVCEFLVLHKADVNAFAMFGKTPLHSMLHFGPSNFDTTHYNILLAFLTDWSLDINTRDTDGRTALRVAREHYLYDAAELIEDQPLYVLGFKKVVMSILCGHHKRCGVKSDLMRIDSECLKLIVLYLLSIADNKTTNYQNRKNDYNFYVCIGRGALPNTTTHTGAKSSC